MPIQASCRKRKPPQGRFGVTSRCEEVCIPALPRRWTRRTPKRVIYADRYAAGMVANLRFPVEDPSPDLGAFASSESCLPEYIHRFI